LGVLLEASVLEANGSEYPLQWIVAGDGAGREALVRQAEERSLPALRFLPLQPDEAFAEMLIAADVCVITQQRGTGQFFFPSKLLAVLGRAKPVLAVADADSELARAVTEGGFGRVAAPGDPAAVAAAARAMIAAGPESLAEWGRRGLEWVGRFRRTAVLEEFERRVQQIAKAR
jgi:colanic acid biosynthesis glycosyl transferase WcaI